MPTLLYNARIYTLEPTLPEADALVIDGGRILAIGQQEKMRQHFDRSLGAEDMQGLAILPGLTDAHIHLQAYALGLQKVDCETPTRPECLARVAERVQITPPGEWILGHGWNQNNWPEGFGRAADLDAIAPQHPIYLTAKSLHAAWVNSAALRQADLTVQTPDPADGKFGRDHNGNLDGILFETAMALVSQVIPPPTLDQVISAIHQAQSILWQMGLTGVHDFDRSQCFSALQLLHQEERLGLRVLKSIPSEDLSHAIGLGLRSGFGDDFLRLGSVKFFADGALGPHTAATLQPYEDDPANRGILMLDGEEIFEQGRRAVANGLSLAVHAIGDRANHEVLNAFTRLRKYERHELGQRPALRHRIEHVQLLHPDDAARLSQNGIIASMQPIHAPSDMLMADRYWGSRAQLAYAWRTQLAQGTVLAFGSDAPVESPNPFWGLHAAVTRQRQDGSPGQQGWYPKERLSLPEALHGFTSGPAFTAGWEAVLGRLAPGYYADLIALAEDPFQIPAEELFRLRPVGTMVNGTWVWRGF